MHRNKFSSVPTWPLTYSMANDKIGEERGWGRGRGRVILIAVAFPRYDFIAGETRNSILDIMNSWFTSLINLCSRSQLFRRGAKKYGPPPPLVASSWLIMQRCLGLIYSAVKKIINGTGRGIFKGYRILIFFEFPNLSYQACVERGCVEREEKEVKGWRIIK